MQSLVLLSFTFMQMACMNTIGGVPVSISPPTDQISPPTDSTSTHFADEWNGWKLQHKKVYVHDQDEILRQQVWMSNKKFIEEHNLDQGTETGYTLAMNQFGDLTYEEWKQMYLTEYHRSNYTNTNDKVFQMTTDDSYPEQLDWRNKNAVTPVKNQGQCGGCYAFSAVGALEGATSLAHDKLITLSEQNIIDCSVPYGNHGCNGGSVYGAFQYMISTGGIDTADSYPYVSKQSTCHYDKANSGSSMSGTVRIPSGKEEELLAAVATVGPVSIAVDASSNAFRFYSGGLFSTVHCSTTNLNHAMVITGYGVTKDKQKYWLVKNSWGTTWGEEGYILMARDKYNQCGIATDASYPTL